MRLDFFTLHLWNTNLHEFVLKHKEKKDIGFTHNSLLITRVSKLFINEVKLLQMREIDNNSYVLCETLAQLALKIQLNYLNAQEAKVSQRAQKKLILLNKN